MSESTKNELAFGKDNYKLFIAAVVVVTIGYLLMVGGGSEDPNVFNADELFSPVRITVAPMVVLVGFALGVYAIMKKSKD
jgi:F0F1-type ATP synthase assembly protein I